MPLISGQHRRRSKRASDLNQIRKRHPREHTVGVRPPIATPECALVQENVFRFNFIGHRSVTAFDDLTSEVQNRRAPFAC
jgi:hypothetical protein